MFLFIDESEDELHFILTAIKSNDRLLEDVIWRTRKKFVRKNKSLKRHQLADLNEFHEHILHDKYPDIKRFIFQNLLNQLHQEIIVTLWRFMPFILRKRLGLTGTMNTAV